jgi:hypothetical protein
MVEARMDGSGAAPPRVGVTRIATSSQEECCAWLEAAGLTVRQNKMAQGPYAAKFDLFSLSPDLQFSLSSWGGHHHAGRATAGHIHVLRSLSKPEGLHFNSRR